MVSKARNRGRLSATESHNKPSHDEALVTLAMWEECGHNGATNGLRDTSASDLVANLIKEKARRLRKLAG